MKTFVAPIFLMLLTGCSTLGPNQTSVTFDSNPPGATISSGAESWGTAPVGRVWTLAKGRTTAESAPITATWISGAKTTITMSLTAGQVGAYTINRPQGVAGLETDVQWAIHLQQQVAAKEAAKKAVADAEWDRVLKQISAAPQPPLPSPTVNCTSTGYGNTVKTHCQ